jgi:putative ABC transport system permease protein
MFLKILKKDLKRKKTMNVIVFLFLVLACVLMAGSSNMLYSTMSAVDYFEDKSQISDFIVVTKSGDYNTDQKITTWGKQDFIKEYQKDNVLIIESKKVSDSDRKKLPDSIMLYLSTIPDEKNLVFDQNGREFEVKQGEVAIPVSIKNKLNLNIGDTSIIEIGKQPVELKVSKIFKDYVFGSEFIDVKRIIVAKDCFDQLYEQSSQEDKYTIWEFTGQNEYQPSDLEKSFYKMPISTAALLTPEYIRGVYVFDMMMAGVMIFASLFLFVIALLILRFTITFTILEDYKEIGVMKAIGIKIMESEVFIW